MLAFRSKLVPKFKYTKFQQHLNFVGTDLECTFLEIFKLMSLVRKKICKHLNLFPLSKLKMVFSRSNTLPPHYNSHICVFHFFPAIAQKTQIFCRFVFLPSLPPMENSLTALTVSKFSISWENGTECATIIRVFLEWQSCFPIEDANCF